MTYDDTQENLRVYKGFTLTRNDPYGFWTISKDGKSVPELEGSYTLINLVTTLVDTHLKNEAKAKSKKA